MSSRLKVLNTLLGLISVVLLVSAASHQNDLPPFADIHPALLTEPQQVQIQRPAFEVKRKQVTYRIEPLYDYTLYGLVVSRHDAGSWLDSIHSYWNDYLNVVDVCVVWGRNLKSGFYANPDVRFTSGQFTCYVHPANLHVWQAFDATSLSNNHLLAERASVIRKLRTVRVGDQIMLRGSLAQYSHNYRGAHFSRSTSVTRDDVGNGACETVFVDQVEVLREGNAGWRFAYNLGWCGLVLSAALGLWGLLSRETMDESA